MDFGFRHGRACPGHPRLSCCEIAKTWMPGTRPGMTAERPMPNFIERFSSQTLRMRSEIASQPLRMTGYHASAPPDLLVRLLFALQRRMLFQQAFPDRCRLDR